MLGYVRLSKGKRLPCRSRALRPAGAKNIEKIYITKIRRKNAISDTTNPNCTHLYFFLIQIGINLFLCEIVRIVDRTKGHRA